ncbi:MAG: hypothetical protein ACLR0U_11730 [Enterocloster clostridioformis]
MKFYEKTCFLTFNGIDERLPGAGRMRQRRLRHTWHRVPGQKYRPRYRPEAETGDQTIVQSGDKTAPDQASESPSGESSSPAPESGVGGELNTGSGENKLTCQAAIRVGSLKGPTSWDLYP